ncbi:MAG: AAA family ATPase [Candidatus Woesearchaeota archaeon]
MEWFEELDFDENPFDTNPKVFADKLVGFDQVLEELLYRINAGSLVFVEGTKGSGKTALLWNVIRHFRGRVVYVDCEKLTEDLNIESLIINKYGLMGRLFKKMPENLVLLVDNVSTLSKTNAERIKYFFDQGYLLSVVFTGTSFKKVNFSKSLLERIGNRIIKLPSIEAHQAVALVRNRIGDIDIISDEIIEELFEKSGKNPRQLLVNLEKIFSNAVESDDSQITKKNLKIIEGS